MLSFVSGEVILEKKKNKLQGLTCSGIEQAQFKMSPGGGIFTSVHQW